MGGKKDLEGIYEKYLKLFMPIWLPIEAIKIMIKEILSERRRRGEKK